MDKEPRFSAKSEVFGQGAKILSKTEFNGQSRRF
jgi:hypothetical protein